MSGHTQSQPESPFRIYALCTLALLSAVAPIATDMYLPGFLQMAESLGASASEIQLTLTSFLIGLALGQLIIGPLSDHWGRRRPLLIGTALAIASGILCTLATGIEALIAFRLLQGFGGAAGVVLARAIIADRAPDSATTARLTQIMMMIGGVAPILAPITGTLIVSVGGWRAVMLVTALLSLISWLGVSRWIGESLPPERRAHAGGQSLITTTRKLLSHRSYLGYTLAMSFSFMALFGYISASPFVFQNVLGLSPWGYSLAFGANAMGLILVGGISAKLVKRFAPRFIIALSLSTLLMASTVLTLLILAHAGSHWILPVLFLAVVSVSPILGNASALAIRQVPEAAGAASAVLGASQFAMGALASPLVGLMGENNALPMALIMISGSLLAISAFYLLTQQSATQRSEIPVSGNL